MKIMLLSLCLFVTAVPKIYRHYLFIFHYSKKKFFKVVIHCAESNFRRFGTKVAVKSIPPFPKLLLHVNQKPRWVRLVKTLGSKNLVTLHLTIETKSLDNVKSGFYSYFLSDHCCQLARDRPQSLPKSGNFTEINANKVRFSEEYFRDLATVFSNTESTGTTVVP